jgi:hypothetical protein
VQRVVILVGSLLLASGWPTQAPEAARPPVKPVSVPPSQLVAEPRVNAPYFDGAMRYPEMAVFWFGRVTTASNSADVRVGYRQEYLEVHLSVMDRRLWYNPSPGPGDLTAWDSATLYVDTDGDTGSAPDAHSYRFDAQLLTRLPTRATTAAGQRPRCRSSPGLGGRLKKGAHSTTTKSMIAAGTWATLSRFLPWV